MLKDRIKKARFEAGLSQAELAMKAGVSQSTITFLESGRNETSKMLPQIAQSLGVTVEYLMFGASGHVVSLENATPNANKKDIISTDDHSEMVSVPFLNGCALSAGQGALNDQQPYMGDTSYIPRKILRNRNIMPNKVFSISVKGDSMEPRFNEGDIVFIDTDDVNVVDGKVYAISYLGQDYIKKLSRSPTGDFFVISDNNIYPMYEAKKEDIMIFGRVIYSQREE